MVMKHLFTGETLHNSYTVWLVYLFIWLVYSLQHIAPTPSLEDDFALCGEDGTVRVWKGTVYGKVVWKVLCMERCCVWKSSVKGTMVLCMEK